MNYKELNPDEYLEVFHLDKKPARFMVRNIDGKEVNVLAIKDSAEYINMDKLYDQKTDADVEIDIPDGLICSIIILTVKGSFLFAVSFPTTDPEAIKAGHKNDVIVLSCGDIK